MPAPPIVSKQTHYFNDVERIFSELSEDEKEAAEESFSVYYRPVEFYRLLRSRASINRLFLTRCLNYKIKDEPKRRRVQFSVSISQCDDAGQQIMPNLPLYIMLAKPVPTPNEEAVQSYRFKRACKLTSTDGALTGGLPEATFVLPETNKLSGLFKSCSHDLLFVNFADTNNQTEIDLTKDHMLSPSNEGYCLMGKFPIYALHFLKKHSPQLRQGEKAYSMSTISLKSANMKLSCLNVEKSVSFQFPCIFKVVQVPITISIEEVEAKDTSPSNNNIYTDELPEGLRPKTGDVLFNFKYYDNMLHKPQVTKDYSCPFCVLKCSSYKGLECHLPASHDLFNYEFWDHGDYKVVIVSAKITDTSSEIVSREMSPGDQQFFYCRKPMRRRQAKTNSQDSNHSVVDSNIPDQNKLPNEYLEAELHQTSIEGYNL